MGRDGGPKCGSTPPPRPPAVSPGKLVSCDYNQPIGARAQGTGRADAVRIRRLS
jgi:hypothetical protein